MIPPERERRVEASIALYPGAAAPQGAPAVDALPKPGPLSRTSPQQSPPAGLNLIPAEAGLRRTYQTSLRMAERPECRPTAPLLTNSLRLNSGRLPASSFAAERPRSGHPSGSCHCPASDVQSAQLRLPRAPISHRPEGWTPEVGTRVCIMSASVRHIQRGTCLAKRLRSWPPPRACRFDRDTLEIPSL